MVTDSRKVILPVFGITGFTLIIVLVVVLLGLSNLNRSPQTLPANDSTSDGACCRTEALRLFQSLDTQADPCDNFYEFTCGQFEQANKLPSRAVIYGSKEKRDASVDVLYHSALLTERVNDSKPVKFIKQAYRVCIKDKLDKNLDIILEQIGLKTPRMTIIDFLGSGEPALLKFDVLPHPLNSSHYALWIEKAPLTIDSQVLKSFANQSDPLFQLLPVYLEYVESIMEKFYPKKLVPKRAKSLIALQVHLANASVEVGNDKNWTSHLFMGKIGDLDAMTSKSFSWLHFIQDVTITAGSEVPVTDDTLVIVRDVDYIKAFALLMEKLRSPQEEEGIFSIETMNDLLKFYLVSTYQFMTDKKTIDYELDHLGKLRNEITVKDYSAKARCLSLLRTYAPELVGRIFVDSNQVKASNMNGLKSMVNATIIQLGKVINESTKVDEESKIVLLNRLESMKINYGHPKWIMDDTALVRWFIFESLKHSRCKYILDRLNETVRQSDILPSYSERPGVFYDDRFNRLVLPASIMTGHYYNSSLPPVVNYATVGLMIAHKVAHTIDVNSLMFDRNGTFTPDEWTGKQLLSNLTDSLNCFESQITSILYPRVNLHLNGTQTKVEDATDQLAIQMAINSYLSLNNSLTLGHELSQFNNKEQFYLAYGNTWCQLFYSDDTIKVSIRSNHHSPRYFRSFLPLLHLNDFIDTFNCTPSSSSLMPRQCALV